MKTKLNIGVIGAGYSSLATACYLAHAGYDVTIYEKNDTIGGRSRQLKAEGFTFDMGPTWYWMPDVFERFFNDLGKSASDYYELIRTDPAYRVYFGEGEFFDIPTSLDELFDLFESEEKGAGAKLEKFLKEAEDNYNIAIKDLVYRPGLSPLELITSKTVRKIGLFFKTISKDVRARFKSEKLRSILEFPVLFLGAKPSNTPAFYNFMNYADMVLGTWHPRGGMFSVIQAMESLAKELNVKIVTSADVQHIQTHNNKVTGIEVNGAFHQHDIVVSGADYAHTEKLLDEKHRKYTDEYWDKRTFAPSALLFYLGLDKKIDKALHHTLFFDTSFEEHAKAIYDDPRWPDRPLFYASFPSKTDDFLAPEGGEACIFLVPIAPGISDGEETREKYFEILMERLKSLTGQDIRPNIVYKRSYCVKDFVEDYNSYKGNAYGLANTLLQTAFLRPSIVSKKVKNMYFTGQLTVPGPGVPPSLISGKIVADKIISDNQNTVRYAAAL
ncbi:MAG: phytoene desaturase [Flavobacteriales bacterium]|nr:phytoene desaturase [Flavobacteriales bacterium]